MEKINPLLENPALHGRKIQPPMLENPSFELPKVGKSNRFVAISAKSMSENPAIYRYYHIPKGFPKGGAGCLEQGCLSPKLSLGKRIGENSSRFF